MAERVVYSCDWCCLDSNRPGFVGDGWEQCDGAWLCAVCFSERQRAVRVVYNGRRGVCAGPTKGEAR